jgi:hypothetical protein
MLEEMMKRKKAGNQLPGIGPNQNSNNATRVIIFTSRRAAPPAAIKNGTHCTFPFIIFK